MAKDFIDHFAAVSSGYAAFRPSYPAALFSWLASVAPGRQRAWDCATGTGQSACALAEHFEEVIATDASASQLAAARPQPRVRYRLASAEGSGLAAAGIDLVCVAQALHWFDTPRFFAEVERVLRPGGVLAAWCYGLASVAGDAAEGQAVEGQAVEDQAVGGQAVGGQAVDALLQHFHHHTVGPFWPPERTLVENGYRDLSLPFPALPAPSFPMTTDWSLEQLLGYLATWSACARYRAERGSDPLEQIREPLMAAWGDGAVPRRLHWPLHLKAARRP